MTEDDIKQLEDSVLSKPMDEAVEQAWMKLQLSEFLKTEQELMCLFKFNKFMGKHDQLKVNEAAIKEVRQSIEYLKMRITE